MSSDVSLSWVDATCHGLDIEVKLRISSKLASKNLFITLINGNFCHEAKFEENP